MQICPCPNVTTGQDEKTQAMYLVERRMCGLKASPVAAGSLSPINSTSIL
jgi:hypothetical protein